MSAVTTRDILEKGAVAARIRPSATACPPFDKEGYGEGSSRRGIRGARPRRFGHLRLRPLPIDSSKAVGAKVAT